jgi:hypothetical protein
MYMVVFDFSSSDKEFDMEEEEEIAMVLLMHKNKKPKHGGLVFGRAYIQMMKIDTDNKLMRNYFVENTVFREKYVRCWFPNIH